MILMVLLDSGPLGLVTNPRMSRESGECAEWLSTLLASGAQVFIPEIVDYEVRRELLRARKARGIERLDSFKQSLGYLPITTKA